MVLSRLSAFAGGCFIVVCFILVLINSSERSSVLQAATSTSKAESYFAGLPEPGGGSSRLRLQEFHRTAIKDGRTVWEIRARDAQYYSAEGITHLDRAALVLYQEDDSRISLKADSAKLHMANEGLSRAELLGEVEVIWENGMRITTDAALYEVATSVISAPGEVHITGDGYEVEGVGLRALVDQQKIRLAREVSTVFSQRRGEGETGASALFKKLGGGK